MKNFFVFFLAILYISACEDQELPEHSIDFYAISDYRTQENSMKIIESSVELSDSVIIPYDDILFYRPELHTFFITEQLSDILSDWENHPLARKPFAVVAGSKIVYTGYFWYGFMSSSCDWLVIDPIDYSGENKLIIQLGYPGLIVGDQIPDHRNDPWLLEILRRNGKLIE